MIKIVRLCGIRKINAGLKEKKKDCGPCERGGSTRATLLVPLKRRPPLGTPTYKTRNMVVARATLVDTRRAAIMPFRIAEREQGPPSSSSSSSLSFLLHVYYHYRLILDLEMLGENSAKIF